MRAILVRGAKILVPPAILGLCPQMCPPMQLAVNGCRKTSAERFHSWAEGNRGLIRCQRTLVDVSLAERAVLPVRALPVTLFQRYSDEPSLIQMTGPASSTEITGGPTTHGPSAIVDESSPTLTHLKT